MDGVITVSAADRAIAQNSGGEAQREKAHEGYRRSGEPLRCVCGTLCARCRCTYRATSLWPSLTNNLCRKERIVGMVTLGLRVGETLRWRWLDTTLRERRPERHTTVPRSVQSPPCGP
jgi:hypothetical protein